jgi:hypothetical protein
VQRVFLCHFFSHNREALRSILPQKPDHSDIEYLELRCCRFTHADLFDVLRVPKVLKTFVYKVAYRESSAFRVAFEDIFESLQWFEESLEELWLDYSVKEDQDLGMSLM